MMRSIHTAAASVAGLLMLAADTGGNAGGTATMEAPPAAPANNPANPAAGETVTNTAGTPGEIPATPPRAKRGKAAAGMSVFPAETLAAAMTGAKEKGAKFTSFTVKVAGKPDRFFVSNHRNAVQHRILTDDGYTMFSGDGTNKGGRKPADPTKRADELLAGMDEETRRALFAKYIGTNPAAAAALPPAAAKRDDTTADFTAATGNGAVAAPATPAAPATTPATVATTGTHPTPASNPGMPGSPRATAAAAAASNAGKGTATRRR